MIDFDEALALLADNVRPLGCEQIELVAAHGRVLAEHVHAAVSSPRRAVSAMDGFALRDADAEVGARFGLSARVFPVLCCRPGFRLENASGYSPAPRCPTAPIA